MLQSRTTLAVPPGETIREQLIDRGMTEKEFALRMGMSAKHISNLINGKSALTSDVSLRLESVLGVPARFWNNLEAIYREDIERVNAENEMEQDEKMAREFPYAEMVKFGWIEKATSITEKVAQLRLFFGVAKLSCLESLDIPGIAYRVVGEAKSRDYKLAVWAQRARIEARDAAVSDINIEKLKTIIPNIRAMTVQPPEQFCEELRSLLASCGVAIVYLPHIGGSFLHGASFIDGKRIVLGMTVRGKDAAKFWFSLFHELYHIIDGHIFQKVSTTEEQELAADSYARDTLISPDKYREFTSCKHYTNYSIEHFAKQEGIDCGIVVGRLQKDNEIRYNQFNAFKKNYEIHYS